MAIFSFFDKILIEGIMPERALLRLKRAGIDLFHVKKVKKNQILLQVRKKDTEKVFAIFPNVCYNISVYSPYTAKKVGATGFGKTLFAIKTRVGLILGGLLFCVGTLFFDSFVFGVEFVGSDVYAREAYAALNENGIKTFALYRGGTEDLVCANLLSIPDVEFCSVKKTGLRLRVEMRLSSFVKPQFVSGDLRASRDGTVLSVTALSGTAEKKTGDTVRAGETLVGGYFQTEEGTKTTVEVIARACIACVYEGEVLANSEELAFAEAYLSLGLTPLDTVTGKNVAKIENGEGFFVRIEYTVVEKLNL